MNFLISVLPKSLVKSVQQSYKIIQTSKRMSKIKDKEFTHIDFENGVVYGAMQQIRAAANDTVPILTEVWCCNIRPVQTKTLIEFINAFVTPFDTTNFTHLKRFHKIQDNSGVTLRTLLCSRDYVDTKENVVQMIHEQGPDALQAIGPEHIELVEVPTNLPLTKEMAQRWSEQYWPLAWKGNPYVQYLKTARIDLGHERKMVKRLLTELEQHLKEDRSTVPVVTIISGKEGSDEDTYVSFDSTHTHPLEHSVMAGIKKVAEKEREARDQSGGDHAYLLNNLTVYTTHEPCVMCSMALVHSRIDKIVFLKSTESGGLGTNYQLGDKNGLNWKFKMWKWIVKEDEEALEKIEQQYEQHQFNA